MYILASFPRSGNHLVRFCIEYVTGRPTLGCYDNPADIPIHMNGFESFPTVLDHVDGAPIAHKTHQCSHIDHIRQSYDIAGLIYIRRHPVEALLAHDNNAPIRQHVSGIDRETRNYLDLEQFFKASKLSKICIEFEKLTSSNRKDYLGELDKLIKFLGRDVNQSRAQCLRKNFIELRNVNKQPGRRSWLGIRSDGPRYWRKSTPFWRRVFVQSVWWKRQFLK